MLGAASLLTLVTLGGLVAGFAREWLLVASWGASARTDAYVIAMFLPEAVRGMLAAGVFTSSALALWQGREPAQRGPWFSQINAGLMWVSVGLAAVFALGAPLWVQLMAPGLADAHQLITQRSLAILAWCLPGIVLQAWWAMPRHAGGHFLLAGTASLLYNLPALAYLGWQREAAQPEALSWAFVAGSALSAAMLWPSARRYGLRWQAGGGCLAALREWGGQLAPLLGSALAGQGITLLERVVASYLGEGVVTGINLARKLMNLPLVALQSLNQVLLSLMSRRQSERLALLRGGLAAVTLVSLPAALGLMLGAPALIALLFPKVQGTAALVSLLAGYAAILVLAGWNTLLARYHYAEGDTRGPVLAELRGSLLQALSLPVLAWAFGPLGIVWALMAGTLLTGWHLLQVPALQGDRAALGLRAQAAVCALLLGLAWVLLRPRLSAQPAWLLAEAAALGLVCLLGVAAWLRPWRVR
ncbi:MAG: oligosaccharide flippase family protein [Proteobacteria bacterium]|uniref:lipid II flippase MurJ n=1 Tax=Aquabacterium sp. TaxID=1872578 RepID=UPI0035C6C630|nr:oligosaccharide flippase family protein [Pseudomonadota bacterium]